MAQCPEIFGERIKLRCVRESDNDLILQLRNQEHITNFIPSLEKSSSLKWITEQRNKPGDYYFAISEKYVNKTIGFIGLYNVHGGIAEWGRWLIDKNPIAAIESMFLIHKFGFDMNLEKIECKTRTSNSQVASLHSRLPYSNKTVLTENGWEILKCDLLKADWPKFSDYLSSKLGKK